MAEAGIGQFLGQHDGAVPAQTAEQDQRNRILPARRQGDVIRRNRPQIAVAQPIAQGRAQRHLAALGGIVDPVFADAGQDVLKCCAEGIRLAHIGQAGGAQVDPAMQLIGFAFQQQGLGRPKARRAGGNEGAAPDRCRQQPLLRRQRIGARHRARRHPQRPGQIAHGRQLGGLRQFTRTDRLAQGARQGKVFGAGISGKVWLPYCADHNVPLAPAFNSLYQSS